LAAALGECDDQLAPKCAATSEMQDRGGLLLSRGGEEVGLGLRRDQALDYERFDLDVAVVGQNSKKTARTRFVVS
jgi:hypothetical protein